MEAEREVADLREDLIKAEQRTRLQLLRAARKSPFEGAPVPEQSVHSITSSTKAEPKPQCGRLDLRSGRLRIIPP
jgi:hypothetical protein